MNLLAQAGEFTPLEVPDIQWAALVPHIILAGGAVILITIASIAKQWLPRGFYALYTAAAGLAALVTSIPLWLEVQDPDEGPFSAIAGAIGIDGFSVFLTVVISSAVVLAALLADDYLRREGMDGPEFYVLLLLSAAGGVAMASANDLIVLFVGLEVLSISVYVLAALDLRRLESQEAGIKYFVLGAFSSAFFLYGIALIYGATGSTNLVTINEILTSDPLEQDGLLLAGFALLLVGLGFKVAAVPFHAWTPDVYQGSPTPAVAYMASGVKAAAFAALLRVFYLTFEQFADDWQPIVFGLAAVTMLIGSSLAIVQSDVKRILAYSSISHAGFILVGVQAASEDGTAAVLFYLAAYTAMVIGSFAVVMLVARDSEEHTGLDDFRGLASTRPALALTFTILLLGQAGIPFTAGFLAKFYVIGAAVEARSYWLAVIAMLTTVIAAFLYLRIILAMYLGQPAETEEPIRIPLGAAFTLLVAVGFTIVFGIIPGPLTDLSRDAVPVLVSVNP